MRIVIQTLGSAGDVHPYVGLGHALRGRGHDVHVLACEAFRDSVEDAGLEFVQCGETEDLERAKRDPDLWHPKKGLSVVVRNAIAPSLRPAYEMIVERIDPGNTVVVASTLGYSAHMVAEVHGVPLAVAHLAPINFRSVHRPPQFPGLPLRTWMPAFVKHAAYWLIDKMSDPVVCPSVNEFRASLGLEPVSRFYKDWVHEVDLLLGMFPPWFAPPQPDWPSHLVLTGFPLWDDGDDATLDPDLEAWLDDGEPPIVFTAGSANLFGKDFYRASIDAAQALGRRAALVTRNPSVLPDPLPDGVRHVDYAPFSRLFRRAAAVVHHGGIGTTAQTLAAGVPAVVAAMGFDQFDNGAHVQRLGAGEVLPMTRYTSKRATAALRRLLDDVASTATCRDLAARLAKHDARSAACDAVESLAPSPAPVATGEGAGLNQVH